MDRSTKERVVSELHDKLKDTKLAILADYSGMNVVQITELRNELRGRDSEMKVVKNNLLRIASKDTDFSSLDDYLAGPLAIIMNFGDVIEPTKVLVGFAKKNAALEVKVGILDGRLLTREEINTLAELPSREILLGKLLSTMVGVQAQFVNVLAEVPGKFVRTLDVYRAQKEN
ncbi:MAG: 50S ribosomal protein L10 [Syntrophaceae bacterium]|nr:50S ribosomal protein L10 [Syntrophaceae bacterium]